MLLCYLDLLQHHVPTKVYYYYPPPAAEIQKSWRKVDFSRISRFREAGGIQTILRGGYELPTVLRQHLSHRKHRPKN